MLALGSSLLRLHLPHDTPTPLAYAARSLSRYLHLLFGTSPSLSYYANATMAYSDLLNPVQNEINNQVEDIFFSSSRDCSSLPLDLAEGSYSISRPHLGMIALFSNDDNGVLYASISLLESLHVSFGLDGVFLPTGARIVSLEDALPLFHSRTSSPSLQWRGLQPFHDFYEGPDTWSEDAWVAVLEAIVGMKGGGLGLHTYPYANTGSPPGLSNNLTGSNEPTVWIGPPTALSSNDPSQVIAAYPTSWANTQRHEWAVWAHPSEAYAMGAGELYEHSCAGHPLQAGNSSRCPWPVNSGSSVDLINDVGAMFGRVFAFAAGVGVKVAVGTEAPLTLPPYPPQYGANLTAQDYYEGAFKRLSALAGENISMYWLWTPESWEWGKVSVNDPRVQNFVKDAEAAQAAWDIVQPPFRLGTSGWVLGPGGARGYLDGVLPSNWTLGSIDQYFGNTPVDPAYANITRHPTMVIPWLEDDPGLTVTELWVNRTIQHTATAAGYNATSILYLHWRTRAAAASAGAGLAAAWNTSLSPSDYWRDFCTARFGESVGPTAGALLSSFDGPHTPRPVTWINGPGAILAQGYNCADLADGKYAPVDTWIASLRPTLIGAWSRGEVGAGEVAAFDWWLTHLRAFKRTAETSCAWAQYGGLIKNISSMPAGPQRQAAARTAGYAAFASLLGNASALIWDNMASLSSPETLGTISNIFGQSYYQHLFVPGLFAQLASLAGESLPPELASLPTHYSSSRVPQLRVPVLRSSLSQGEDLLVRLVFDQCPPQNAPNARAASFFFRKKNSSLTSITTTTACTQHTPSHPCTPGFDPTETYSIRGSQLIPLSPHLPPSLFSSLGFQLQRSQCVEALWAIHFSRTRGRYSPHGVFYHCTRG